MKLHKISILHNEIYFKNEYRIHRRLILMLIVRNIGGEFAQILIRDLRREKRF